MLSRLPRLLRPPLSRSLASFPPPRLFSYDKIVANMSVADAIPAIEDCFIKLAQGQVDVPMPMHIGIPESGAAGPGDCHVKGGHVIGASTWTVKLANVSFYKNPDRGLPPGSGVFIVVCSETGAPLGIFSENRYLTDCRTGAAGGVAFKHCAAPGMDTVGFIGAGAIAKVMARAASCIRPFRGVVYAPDGAEAFKKEMENELSMPFEVVDSAEKLCRKSDVIYTQTPGSKTVLEKKWLKDRVTIIASGSDQPTKQELPTDVMAASTYITDLTNQCVRVGELRSAVKDGSMKESDVYAELGEVVAGMKPSDFSGIVVVDLTGTGAQDAAIGTVAWDKMSKLPE
ncbi:hypothetical protein TeGR_g9641 [Tetraparma gracilis]|uniref:Ornithine cyclodeaminase n=1 Tax=Tetraparma gracilis TaxID=2962635 RepID=A0ABQ6MAJ6_9STRA|nr:hypothetical protein TeGR_g9641 [Tetraparma gracilis]